MSLEHNARRIAEAAIATTRQERPDGPPPPGTGSPPGRRVIVALAGPPGVGKSTLSEALRMDLERRGRRAAIVPMDGFHLDNAVLEVRGQIARKGAPFTFDAEGFLALMQRLRAAPDGDIAIPVFDRALDLARAGGRIITPQHEVLIVEGNYLLLGERPWAGLAPMFDLTVMLKADLPQLRERLVRRWRDHGLGDKEATARAMGNDIPNAELVLRASQPADIELDSGA